MQSKSNILYSAGIFILLLGVKFPMTEHELSKGHELLILLRAITKLFDPIVETCVEDGWTDFGKYLVVFFNHDTT